VRTAAGRAREVPTDADGTQGTPRQPNGEERPGGRAPGSLRIRQTGRHTVGARGPRQQTPGTTCWQRQHDADLEGAVTQGIAADARSSSVGEGFSHAQFVPSVGMHQATRVPEVPTKLR
jgi:hypothetical protein